MSKSGIVNVRMVITEEKILSNMDKVQKLINPNTDIIINNHVWIGTRSLLLKGTVLPPNSVVGAMSLVNKTFEEPNSLIAGIPAKVIKRNINWSRQFPPETCSIS